MPPLQLDNLGKGLLAEYQEAVRQRRPWEQRWLMDLRQDMGIYDPEIMARLKKAKRSKLFIRLTRVKRRWMRSKMMAAVFPADGSRNWNTSPTKDPEVNPLVLQKALDGFAREWGRPPANQVERETVREEAAEIAARAMAEVIEDQISEHPGRAGYRGVARKALDQGLRYGHCVLKGPQVEQKEEARYVLPTGGDGAALGGWDLRSQGMAFLPYIEAPDIWRIYPDPNAASAESLRYVFHEHLWTKAEFQKYAQRRDFRGGRMLAHMRRFRDGDADLKDWERDVRTLMGERPDAKESPTIPADAEDRYRVIERWGWIPGDKLADAGEDLTALLDPGQVERLLELAADEGKGEEEQDQFLLDCARAMDFPCLVFMLSTGEIIKYVPQPLKGVAIPYYFWWYEKDEHSMFGDGIPADMRDPQGAFNAALRAAIDHMGAVAGPQVAFNASALADPNDTDIVPFKKWIFNDVENMDTAIKFFSMSSNINEYIRLLEFLQNFIDEVTVPRYMHGDSRVSGAGRTMRGLSMLMGTFGVNVDELVKTWDDNVAAPFIRAMYHWNMQLNPREDIKGDYNVVAFGSSALVAKEVQSEAYAKALDVSRQPEYAPYINRAKALRGYFRSIEADSGVIYGDEEVEQNRERDLAMQYRAGMQALIQELGGQGVPMEQIAALLAGSLAQKFNGQAGPSPGGGAPQQGGPPVAPDMNQQEGVMA